MIRDSLYFMFDGRKSIDFKLGNININEGLYEEVFLTNRSIQETSVRRRIKPLFNEVKRDPKSFQVSFRFLEPWNDDLIEEILEWLDVDYYKPLSFNEEKYFNKVYFAMPVENISLVHNGLKQGYFTLTFRCNSPYAYSPLMQTSFDCSKGDTEIVLENMGRMSILPDVKIHKVGSGNIEIKNLSNAGNILLLTSLQNEEEVEIIGENEILISSLGIPRYDNFNDEYIELSYGQNRLKVTGSCYVTFRYRYTFR
ncbi:phage tail family protein [Shigella flexneri]|nr:phage tail family protein [Shigella flexneri]